jgi:histidyl-tRNA synthetase
MKEANRQNAPYAMIIGGNELEAEAATVKEMKSGEQEEVSFDELNEYLRNHVRVSRQSENR